jgi:hypothetical protein
MAFHDILEIATAIIASVGGAGLILFGLSNWLGKVWAERLMQKERQQYNRELEELRNSLRSATEERLASLQAQLHVTKEALVREHADRIAIYRIAVDLLAGIVAKAVMISARKRGPLNPEELLDFETQRLRVYGYLAMHAPQSVMDANDALTDYVLENVADGKQIDWPIFRGLAVDLLNKVREDVGLRVEPIAYRGTR